MPIACDNTPARESEANQQTFTENEGMQKNRIERAVCAAGDMVDGEVALFRSFKSLA